VDFGARRKTLIDQVVVFDAAGIITVSDLPTLTCRPV
jgi:hypothetical protein